MILYLVENVVKFILILLSLWGFWYLSGKDFILDKLKKFIPFDNDVENNKSGSKKHAHINYLKYVFRLIFVGLFSAAIIPVITGTWLYDWSSISIRDDAGLRTSILTATGGVVVFLTFVETRRKNDKDAENKIDDVFRDRKLKGLEFLGSENSLSRLIGFDMLSVLIDEKIKEGDKQEAQQILNHICNNISVSSKENKDKNISRANNHMVVSIRRHYHRKDKYTKVSWSDLSLEFFDCDFKINTTFERMEVKHKFVFRNCRFHTMRFRGSKINELHFIDCKFGHFVGSGLEEVVLDLSSVVIGEELRLERYVNGNGKKATFERLEFSEGCKKPFISLGEKRGEALYQEFDTSDIYDAYNKVKNSPFEHIEEQPEESTCVPSSGAYNDKIIDSSNKPASKGPVQVPYRDSKKSLPQNMPQRRNMKRLPCPVESQQLGGNAQSPENANHGAFGLSLGSTSNKKNGEVGQSNSSRQPAPRVRPVPRQR